MNPLIPQDKKNIAFVASDARSLVLFRKNAMIKLKELGFTIHVIAPQSVFATQLVNLGFEFHHLPLDPYNTDLKEEVRLIPLIYHIYKENNIALAFHYTAKLNMYGSLAAGRAGIPCIAIQTGLGELPLIRPGIRHYILHRIYAFALRWSNEVWLLNHKDLNYFMKHRLAPVRKLKRLKGEGIDLSYYCPQKVEREDNELRFLFLGRLLKSKGIHEFVEAARQIRKKYENVRFLVAGIFNLQHPRSINAEDLYRWQKEGIIEFLGEHMDVRNIFASSDCLVHPSYYNEGMSRVLMEAAAMELPVITTDQVGCRELVRDRYSGFIVPKRDIGALVDAIEEVIQMDATDRMVLGKNGRIHVENHFEESQVIEKYLNTVTSYLDLKISRPEEGLRISNKSRIT